MTVCQDCNQEIKLRNSKNNIWRKTCLCPAFNEFEPKERATIIVPSRYPDIFESCRESIDKFAPKENKILVRDGQDIVAPNGWTTIQAPEGNFCFSRNINVGLRASSGDVLLTNDDVQFTHPYTLEILQGVLAANPDIGVLSPKTLGDVGCYAQAHVDRTVEYSTVRLCFVCVLIRREVLDVVGLMDETIGANGAYGGDDCDYCRRVVNAGFKLAATSRAVVRHGNDVEHRSRSYNREGKSFEAMDGLAQEQYKAKWGDYSLECLGKK